MIKSVCVYCGSSNQIHGMFKDMAASVGQVLGAAGIDVVYGGGSSGLMGILAESAQASGGSVIGYMTHFLKGHEGTPTGLSELHIVDTMHERKQLMFDRSDGILVLPGGLGTLDEIFEVMTWKQVGMHRKKIVFMDYNGYWTPLLSAVFDHMIHHGFVREEDRFLFDTVTTVDQIVPAFLKIDDDARSSHFQSKWS